MEQDLSTEEKIKEAARKLFQAKGYAGTKTREIAEEAGINLALLNYYFRSKEKLFKQIMMEKIQKLFGTMLPIMMDSDSDLETKIDILVERYTELLRVNVELPLFVLNEMKNHANTMEGVIFPPGFIKETSFFKQLQERRSDINPFHFILNLLGMTLFPFIARGPISMVGGVDDKMFDKLVLERKALVPIWMKNLLETM